MDPLSGLFGSRRNEDIALDMMNAGRGATAFEDGRRPEGRQANRTSWSGPWL